MGFFGAAHGLGGGLFGPSLPKTRDTYPAMMKLFQRKSGNFATSKNAHVDWNLIDNF